MPLPASVLTTPAVIVRMRWLLWSATYTVPLPSTATPKGLPNCAVAPGPSALPAVPLPASVLTIPVAVILRMRWLPRSATYKVPLPSTATPKGPLNCAVAPVPSA